MRLRAHQIFTRIPELGVLCAFLICSLAGCERQESGAATWNVLVTALPEKVLKDNLGDGTVTYIFRQTHEPLFRQEDGQNFTSRVLCRWTRSLDGRNFLFCPARGLRLTGDVVFTSGFLSDFLRKITARIDAEAAVSESQGCVGVRFRESQPGYLTFLSSYFNAPSIEKGNVSYGLGAFEVGAISKERITLVRKNAQPKGYNRIVLYPYSGPGDPKLEDRAVADYNNLSSFQQPAWVKNERHGFDNVELRAVGLAINHPDAEMRRALYNCLDVDEFRRAAVPARKDFYDIQTVLPVGVPGAKGGRPKQVCSVPKRLRGQEIVLANARADNAEQLDAFSRKFSERTGIRLKVRQFSPAEMNKLMFGKYVKRPYNLALIVTLNSSPDQDGFFAFYTGEYRAMDYVPSEVVRANNGLRKENSPEKKCEIAGKLAARLGELGLALPLYQTVNRLYYPSEIRNLNVGRGFMEVPDVAEFRW